MTILLLLVALAGLVNLTSVQNYLARRASGMLSDKLKTKVVVGHVRVDFLSHVLLQGLYIQDLSHDTLLYAGEVQVRITDWFVFKDKPVLHYLGLKNTYVHLYRTPQSKAWNYDFIADAFSTPGKHKEQDTGSSPISLDLKKVELENVRFHMDDKWVGEDLDFDIGSLALNAKDLDFKKRKLDVSSIAIKNAVVSIQDYIGGRPKHLKPARVDTVDNTPFNPDNWAMSVKDLSLNDCIFRLKMNDNIPVADHFDENHLDISNIDIYANGITIVGDTIRGQVDHMSAQERCGLAIKNMRSKVSVSPIASICDELYLETNNSKVRDYYAMHYKRFPDFTSYIDSVVMVGHLKDATIDERDIAYFAPELKKMPAIIAHVSGNGKGTVANLSGDHLDVSDGNVVVKGNVTMKGLPDIYKTYITYTDGEILTTGSGILHYVPELKSNTNVAIDRINYAYFKGSYEGYIENFAVNGVFNTNLGTVAADVKMNIPGFNSNAAAYSGTIVADQVQLGTFFRQPLLGEISLKEHVSGKAFDPDLVQLDVDGDVKQVTIKGYTYHNISTKGTIAKKQFEGSLLVDDPNLALEFDGGINYSGKTVNIKATAHLLGSNFKVLNITPDTITASADFDLDCTGSDIDNFSGYAKLFNIDMKRNSHKLAIDSIYVNSTGDSMQRLLTVQSNDVTARVSGRYQLSKLPASFQYYLSRYIPGYINAPSKYAPEQNLEFTVTTAEIDSIFAVTFPMVRGFDYATINGSLNTTKQKLTLTANVPYGSIGNVHMTNVALAAQGNLDAIAVNTTIDNIAYGDSILNGSLSLTTTVGNDSVAFTIATTSPDTSSSITLNGNILARKDSLFLSVLPSQFYLNQAKWDIAGGSKVVYSDKYLFVDGISLSSGLQHITAGTQLENNDKIIIINTENLDLGQLGSWAGLAPYQPDGRVNGTVRIEKVFQDMFVSANVRATDVKLGADTVGTINIIGTYNGAKKLITFDPQTGIYFNTASVSAAGNISFDSSTNQKLDGNITFTNAPVSWASPFLAGVMSHLSGTLNGRIDFGGRSYEPEISGSVMLANAGVKLDYMGCTYTIPTAKIHIDNKRISFGRIELFDVYKNPATLSGYFSHNLFKDMRMRLNIRSEKFQVMNLTSTDNNIFYGSLIAGMDSFTIRGPFNNIRLNLYNAVPAAKSRIYIPVSTGGDLGTYSYVSFKTYGKNQEKIIRKSKDRIAINIDANLNPLAEIHIVLDPSTGDEIMAKGSGNIQMEIPPNNDIHIAGLYSIDDGTYTFTFKQLFINRQFKLNSGSSISFNGPFSETNLSVDAVYSAKARLYDLLNEQDKPSLPPNELIDAETPQWVDVLLHMNGPLTSPKLTFDLDLENKHSQSTLAYRKLMLINGDERQKFDQVASLLLIGDFIPPDGIGGSTVASGAINNISQIISSTASTGLTNIINKITGDKQVNVAVRYTNYNYNDQSTIGGGINRSQVKVGISKNYFNDRLAVELGSTSDWGRPTSASSTSNFNITGDFRIQYLLSQSSGLRLDAFRTSDYDVTLDRDIIRSGLGIGWRKSFDNFSGFIHGNRYARKQKEALDAAAIKQEDQDDSTGKRGGE